MPLLSYPSGSTEPVTTADAMLACRLDDALTPQVAGLITVARQQAEHITYRSATTSSVCLTLGDRTAAPVIYDVA